jgi:hypothetical protein
LLSAASSGWPWQSKNKKARQKRALNTYTISKT